MRYQDENNGRRHQRGIHNAKIEKQSIKRKGKRKKGSKKSSVRDTLRSSKSKNSKCAEQDAALSAALKRGNGSKTIPPPIKKSPPTSTKPQQLTPAEAKAECCSLKHPPRECTFVLQ